MTKAVTASLWNFAANWGQQLFSTAIFLYLAYLLTPTDFGLAAMGAAVVDLLTVAGRFGQVEALLQRSEQGEKEDEHTSFWLVLGLGILLSITVVVAGAFADRLYSDERIRFILWLLAPIPAIQSLAIVNEYLARKLFLYRAIATRGIIATVASGVFALTLALLGFGYYALVVQKLVFTIVSVATLLIFQPWRPKATFNTTNARKLIVAGFNISVSNLVNMANGRIIDLFVGHYLGFAALGTLRIAWRLFDLLMQFIVQPVANVSISSFTAVKGDQGELRRQLLVYISALAGVSFPILLTAGLGAPDALDFIVGSKWEQSGVMLSLLCLSAVALPVNYLAPSLLVALNRSDMLRNQAVFQLAFTSVTVYFSAQVGLAAVMMTHVCRVYIFWLYNLYVYNSVVSVPVLKTTHAISGPLFMTVVCCALQVAGYVFVPQIHNDVVLFSLNVASSLIVYGSGLLLGEHFRLWPGNMKNLAELMQSKTRKLT